MNVNKWGPGGWQFLHTMTFNYPEYPTAEDKKRYTKFFNQLGHMLPCRYCRDSYNIYKKYLPINKFTDSREGVTYWLYQIHNLVNNKVFNEDNTTFEEVVRKYERFRAGCKTVKKNGDSNKKYGTCGEAKDAHLKDDKITKFVKNTETKYKPIAKKCFKRLINCKENPNKESIKYI
tara:strand:+ start:1532 stop:2059 length:528 start_codon:yes stop_codon:yes gene_type:complete